MKRIQQEILEFVKDKNTEVDLELLNMQLCMFDFNKLSHNKNNKETENGYRTTS